MRPSALYYKEEIWNTLAFPRRLLLILPATSFPESNRGGEHAWKQNIPYYDYGAEGRYSYFCSPPALLASLPLSLASVLSRTLCSCLC